LVTLHWYENGNVGALTAHATGIDDMEETTPVFTIGTCKPAANQANKAKVARAVSGLWI